MIETDDGDGLSGDPGGAGRLWPSAAYAAQVQRLRSAVGRRIYLVEITAGDTNVGVNLDGQGHELLAVIEFPRPDPEKGLAPHLVLLDDGRGLNLGRVARISVRRPFAPAPEDILYGDAALLERFLFRERTLSQAAIAERSRALLGALLGRYDQRQRALQAPRDDERQMPNALRKPRS